MQTWPALRYLKAAMVSAAFSGSASANTTTGEWPPSSMVVRFMPLAASCARCLPTGIEPVNEIFRTASLDEQMLGDFGRHAEHQVEHALGQAGVGEAAHHLDAGAGCLLRRLQDQRAAGGERAADLAGRRQHREIPRREGGDHADRLLHHELADALAAARHDAAIRAAAFLGVPVDDVGGDDHLAARLGIRLALLQHHDLGDRVMALAHQVGGLVHDLAAVVGRGGAPDREALLGGFQRLVEVGGAGMRQMRQRLLGRRIDDVLALVAAAVLLPRAVDEKAKLAVHDTLVCFGNVPRAKV